MGEEQFKAAIVWLIANGRTEQALEQLARHHHVQAPSLKVGLPKGRKRKARGAYLTENKTICVLDSDTLKSPFVILHEFYHHIRTGIDKTHKGVEKYADEYAAQFLQAYQTMTADETTTREKAKHC